MKSYSELLQDENWKLKRQIILERDKSLCSNCYNFNHLSDLFVGYIKRKDDSGELLVGWNISGLRNCTIVDLDTDYNWYMLYITEKEKIDFNKLKNYVVYFEIKDQHRNIVAICEEDKNYAGFHSLLSKESNPYRKKEFIKFAKYVQLKGLHIHHTFYQEGRLPWEYPNESLITVCWKCHEEIHSIQEIPYLDINGKCVRNLTPCGRCKGAGYLPQYRHVENGICFECRGKRFYELMV